MHFTVCCDASCFEKRKTNHHEIGLAKGDFASSSRKPLPKYIVHTKDGYPNSGVMGALLFWVQSPIESPWVLADSHLEHDHERVTWVSVALDLRETGVGVIVF